MIVLELVPLRAAYTAFVVYPPTALHWQRREDAFICADEGRAVGATAAGGTKRERHDDDAQPPR